MFMIREKGLAYAIRRSTVQASALFVDSVARPQPSLAVMRIKQVVTRATWPFFALVKQPRSMYVYISTYISSYTNTHISTWACLYWHYCAHGLGPTRLSNNR